MNDIQIFNNEEFGAVRTTGTPEQPLFCLADVARVLGLKTSKLVQRLSDDVLSKYPISDSLGREQVTNFINEDGLYDVILDSRKPEAKRFRKWVTSEVLPSIRKHGAYMTQQTIEKALAEPDFLIRLAVNLKEERQKRLLVEQECEHQRTRIVELGSKVDDLQQEVTEMKDKVSYLDIILANEEQCPGHTDSTGLWRVVHPLQPTSEGDEHPVSAWQAVDSVCRLQGLRLCDQRDLPH